MAPRLSRQHCLARDGCIMRTSLLLSLLVLAVICRGGDQSSPGAFPDKASLPAAHDLSGSWDLRIENPQHQLIATLSIIFTSEPARSCMSGEWRRVEVNSRSATDEAFFPTAEPLSYEVTDGQLVIGRNEVCDGYLQLVGTLNGSNVTGDYVSVGLGGVSKLGYFSLNRVQ